MVEQLKDETDIINNLAKVQASITKAAKTAGHAPGDVTLVAVGKSHTAERVRSALEAGHRVFGENRVQEAEEKWPPLKAEFPDTQLHLIGPLQSNKVRRAVRLFDVIETVDRPKLAHAITRESEASGWAPACFIQVNTGEEDQKTGVRPADTAAFVAECRDQLDLPIVGLMCIPPIDEEPSLHFALLAEIARRNGLASLSMGMSGNYELAVRFGATHVRVGTAIFGARSPLRPGRD